ncbi:MAG: hypothetical protein U0822_10540 [Anaerolineae bacterium]
MISPILGQAAFSVAVFVTICALGLLPFEKPGSAEFVATVIAGVAGILGIVFVAVLVRIQRH